MQLKSLPFLFTVLLFFPAAGSDAQAPSANGIRSFLYQLQNISLNDIRDTGFDLVILDYSADGTGEAAFSAAEIDGLKTGPSGDKIVLSYLSIGEAEDYRFYWQSGWKPGNPSWLDQQNPDWPGNYKVRFWEDGWRSVVSGYLDKIIDAGFDGIYCDIIDAYEYYRENGRTTAAREMADFVSAIRGLARSRDRDFLVFAQNGAELAVEVPSYLDAVDGIGQEDIYYGYEGDGKATPADVTSSLEGILALYRDAGKPVLTVDYPFSSSEDIPHYDAWTRIKIDKAYSRSRALGFIPYCSVRNLDFLTVNPGHEPAAVVQSPFSRQPGEFVLLSSYPNPFNGGTVISFRTESPSTVNLKIFDALGRETADLYQGRVGAGIHECRWDGRDGYGSEAAAGVYLARLQIDGRQLTRKLALIR